MNHRLILLLALAGNATALPLISNEAQYCAKPQVCLELTVSSIDSPDPALNRYGDGLLFDALDSAPDSSTAVCRPEGLDKPGLEKRLRSLARELELAQFEPRDPAYSYDYDLSQVGESANYRVLDLSYGECLGGAHCNGGSDFYVLPKAGELRALGLDDILLPNQRPRLEELLKQAAASYLQEDSKEAVELGAEDRWQWYSGDWRPAREGLIFRYGTGQLDGYAGGMPELLISKEQLRGVIKPEILAEGDSWQSQERGKMSDRPQWRD